MRGRGKREEAAFERVRQSSKLRLGSRLAPNWTFGSAAEKATFAADMPKKKPRRKPGLAISKAFVSCRGRRARKAR